MYLVLLEFIELNYFLIQERLVTQLTEDPPTMQIMLGCTQHSMALLQQRIRICIGDMPRHLLHILQVTTHLFLIPHPLTLIILSCHLTPIPICLPSHNHPLSKINDQIIENRENPMAVGVRRLID